MTDSSFENFIPFPPTPDGPAGGPLPFVIDGVVGWLHADGTCESSGLSEKMLPRNQLDAARELGSRLVRKTM
jgi:hypothetical protein